MHMVFENGRASLRIVGMQLDCMVPAELDVAVRQIEDSVDDRLLISRVKFKNDVVNGLDSTHHLVGGRGSIRVEDFGDVVFIPWSEVNTAATVAILNADSPWIAFMTKQGLYGIHGGLRCLCPDDPIGTSVFDTVFRDIYAKDDHAVACYIGGGIGPCCYGMSGGGLKVLEDKLRTRYTGRLAGDITGVLDEKVVATRGPRSGQTAINLPALAILEAGRAAAQVFGGNDRQLAGTQIAYYCTSCSGDPDFWSHTREPTPSRNLTAWTVIRPNF